MVPGKGAGIRQWSIQRRGIGRCSDCPAAGGLANEDLQLANSFHRHRCIGVCLVNCLATTLPAASRPSQPVY